MKRKARPIPNATNTPNTRTGGIGVSASEAKPAADVSDVNAIGRQSVRITVASVRRTICSSRAVCPGQSKGLRIEKRGASGGPAVPSALVAVMDGGARSVRGPYGPSALVAVMDVAVEVPLRVAERGAARADPNPEAKARPSIHRTDRRP